MRITITVILLLLPNLLQAELAPAWFNSGMNNRDITFSPDGSIMLTTITAPRHQSAVIAISQRKGKTWSPLEVVPFSGSYPDIEPAFAPDGQYLYFASKRPKPGREGSDWDLWRVAFTDNQWGRPEHLGDAINTQGNEFYPSLTRSGKLYFTATREDTVGREDIYVAHQVEGKFIHVENVGSPVNSAVDEFNAFIAPDESYLLFGAHRREGEIGGGDIYYSRKTATGFSEPILLPAPVNTDRLDYCPSVANGRLYFTSERFGSADLTTMPGVEKAYQSPGNGFGDIYSVNIDAILPE